MNEPTTEAGKKVAEELCERISDEWYAARGDIRVEFARVESDVAAIEAEARRSALDEVGREVEASFRPWESPQAVGSVLGIIDRLRAR